MIGKEEIRRIRELIGAKEGPVLSLYVDVNPAKPENAGRAYALRAKDAMKARTEVEEIETGFLENIAATLPGVPVVCTLPVWFPKAGPLFIEKTWKKIHDIGFRPILPAGVNPHHPERLSMLYHRPDQSVGREIVLLKPIKK